jgi:LPPG:FO 2-phospho-L-lactate transferase
VLVALAGGVGAARFLRGLVDVVDPASVTAIVNTGDDDEFHGLRVCPDLDSVTYTLAGAHNHATGWGLEGETFTTMDALDRYGASTWFRLGDKDLATHLFRTARLREGRTLTEVTAEVTAAWGLRTRLLPMSDDRVATRITVEGGAGAPRRELAMQEWFVRERCEPTVAAVHFAGATAATPAPGVLDALRDAETILVCPSNPVISIGPILAVPGIREVLAERRDHVVGVSPIIGGRPVKGPADRLMGPLGIEVSSVGVAATYRDVCSALVIDTADAHDAARIADLGVRPVVTETMMRDSRVAAALARETLAAVA